MIIDLNINFNQIVKKPTLLLLIYFHSISEKLFHANNTANNLDKNKNLH